MKTSTLFLVLAVVASAANSQWLQQGSKLIGSGAVNSPNPATQGVSVALSADGNTAIVGGSGDSGSVGAAWVFVRTNGVWTQQGGKLVGTGSVLMSRQGSSVSLSADGNTAIVGGNADDAAGAVWVFVRTNGVWSQQGSKLVGTGAVGNAQQGVSVSLSADGNTVLVGGPSDSAGAGAAWVFTRSGGNWTQQGSKLVGTGATGKAQQGCSGSLSADGNTALVGGHYDSDSAGAAWVFTRSGGPWTQQGSKLVGTGAVNTPRAARQGRSVSISGDGNTAIVGGWYDSAFAGAAWVFTRTSSVWSQQGNKLVGTSAVGSARQGRSISISADGNTAIVGGNDDNGDVGAGFLFTRSNGVWSHQGKLVGTGAVGTSRQGISVCLSSDGRTALVGGFDDDGSKGAVWAFARSSTSVGDVPMPGICELMQNYPNPFNPTTVVRYQLPVVSNVKLLVYDMLGREVSTLVNEKKDAGVHEVTFDARLPGGQGSNLASGVYFYRLSTTNFVQTRKLVLLR